MTQLHNRVDRRILKKNLEDAHNLRTTLSFYQYAKIGNVNLFRDHFYLLLSEVNTFGRVYVAHEGVNAQVSVPSDQLAQFRKLLDQILFLRGCRLNIAREDDGKSFYKLIVKIRGKIVADGIEDESFDVTDNADHIDASQFNKMTSNHDTVVIDMRNHYESEVGHFENAICPDVTTFRESLPIVEDILEENKDKKVIMYCTGGIRCEKATAYFKHKGYDNLFQLDGGIIEYARQAKEQLLPNKFIGKNFVFDDRLGERISSDIIAKCHQCGMPCDDHTNCANDACHILFIQCKNCGNKYNNCCSDKCANFNELPEDERKKLRKVEIFNGTKFGKGRYKAAKGEASMK